MNDNLKLYRISFGFFAVFALGYLVYLLSPVLTPFLIAAIFAYMGDPIVDRLEKKVSRSWAVLIVFCILSAVVLTVLLVLLPLVSKQFSRFLSKAPEYITWLQTVVLPWLDQNLGLTTPDSTELDKFKELFQKYWQQAGSFALMFVNSLTQSSLMLIAWLANLILIPVVTFYLLRDWDIIIMHIRELIPRQWEDQVVQLAKQSDEVLGSFLRGQLLVMLALSLVYSTGLWLVGLDFGILIGLLAGLVSFVPYLGFIVGFCVAGIAALVQYQDFLHIVLVLGVFGVGQMLEGMWLTPLLVGDRIGLHPVAVIFAVLAGGQLFGFFGVLLALPIAAVIMVLIRFAHDRYKISHIYANSEP